MDYLSLLTGFIVGTLTGAAGTYFADNFTDLRREKKMQKEVKRQWEDLESRFPKIIAEMRQDLQSDEHRNCRAFFVKAKDTMIAFTSEPCFEYHTDVHPDLRPAILRLLELGYISDITPKNTPMYRIRENLVYALLDSKK